MLQLAWNYGGPASALYGWLIVSGASLLVGLSMAEIVSALPSCGGPYFWTSVLAGKHGPLMGWITGKGTPLTMPYSNSHIFFDHCLQQTSSLSGMKEFLTSASK